MHKKIVSVLVAAVVVFSLTTTVFAVSYSPQSGTLTTYNGAQASATFTPTPTYCSASCSVTNAPLNSWVTVSGELRGDYTIILSTGERYDDSSVSSQAPNTSVSLVVFCPSNAVWKSINANFTLTCDGVVSNPLNFTA